MNIRTSAKLILLSFLFLYACQRPFLSDSDGTLTPKAEWEKISYESERPILGMHTTPFEWYVITENEFARFDDKNTLLDKRPLLVNDGAKGIPVLSDNTFFRLTVNPDASQVAEFHLARNPAEVYKIQVDSLVGPNESFIQVDVFARQLGAFSDDGTLFLLPTTVLPGRHYVLLLFQIQHNTAHSSFASIEIVKRINLSGFSADVANLNNIRFLDGNFYVTSKEGAWRVTPSGQADKIFYQWMLDCFAWQGDLYATGTNNFDLHKSTDNGITWERLNQISDLQYVEPVGTHLFTHSVLGQRYKVMTGDDLKTASEFIYPDDGPNLNSISFYGVGSFSEHYYFTMGREVFFTDEVSLD